MSQVSPGDSRSTPDVLPLPECRICRNTTPPLQHACDCASVVHPHCLRRWLDVRADARFPLLSAAERHVCEVCQQPVHADVRRQWHRPVPRSPPPAAPPTPPPRAVGGDSAGYNQHQQRAYEQDCRNVQYTIDSSNGSNCANINSNQCSTSDNITSIPINITREIEQDGEREELTEERVPEANEGAQGNNKVLPTVLAAVVKRAQGVATSIHFPYAWTDRAESLCHYLLSVEGCVLIFLAVLAAMGHALFVLGIYRKPANDAYSSHRLALAAANAVLTVTVLVLVHKIVSRCLRDAESASTANFTGSSAFVSSAGAGYVAMDGGSGGGSNSGVRWTLVGQVALGVVLSFVAAAEIFLIIQHLPLGVLS